MSFRVYVETPFVSSKTRVKNVEEGVYAVLWFEPEARDWRIQALIFQKDKFKSEADILNWIENKKLKIKEKLQYKIWNKDLRRYLIFLLDNIKLERRE